MNKVLFSILVLLFLVSVNAVAFTMVAIEAGTIHVPNEYPTIQAAINAASPGDTVYVTSGMYRENVVINKTISLVGGNPDTTRVYGTAGRTAVSVEADSVVVTGFTISSGGPNDNGLLLGDAKGCEISNDKVVNSFFGIEIILCSNCSILDNSVSGNHYGIGGDHVLIAS